MFSEKETFGILQNLPSKIKMERRLYKELLNFKLDSKEMDEIAKSEELLTSFYLPDEKPGIFVINGNMLAFVFGSRFTNFNKLFCISIIFYFYDEKKKKFLESDFYQSNFFNFKNKTETEKIQYLSFCFSYCKRARNLLKDVSKRIKDIEDKKEFQEFLKNLIFHSYSWLHREWSI